MLANRLSAASRNSVLLLEAGRDTAPGAEPADVRDLYPLSYFNKANMWPGLTAHWRTRSDSPAGAFAQARIMGGGSSVMVMVALRGTPDDYDEWQALGAEGWSWRNVLPYFVKLENDLDFGGELHGREGPVPIRRTPQSQWPPLPRAVQAYAAARGMPFIADMNADFRDGFAATPMSNTPERRASSAWCYLDATVRARANLEIAASTTVRSLILEGLRVTGVRAIQGGKETGFFAGEVILSAGAIHSPALLLRSGIGPAEALRALGIQIAADLPGVGGNLSNHAVVIVGTRLKPAYRQPGALRASPTACFRYSSGGAMPADMSISIQSKSSWNAVGGQLASLAAFLLKPASRGRLTLVSARPDEPPCIEFNLAGEEKDVERLMDGFARIADIVASPEVKPLFTGEPFPVRLSNRIGKLNDLTPANAARSRAIAAALDFAPWVGDRILSSLIGARSDLHALAHDRAALAAHVRENIAGVFHPAGTCCMGRADDPHAVVDTQGRVRGVAGLRVVDASVMPTLPRGNTNLPTLMVAEKMAHAILGER